MAIRAAWALVLAMGVAGMPAQAAETVKVNPALEAVLAGDPPFRAQALRLADLPVAAGPAVSLFNGRDLADWDAWLGYPDAARTYRAQPGQAPIGADAASISRVFQVVMEEGEPAIFITGRTWGGIVHRGDHANYHLRLEYKWGETKYPPRLDMPRNNGLLYHSHGAAGAVYGTWMAATEFEIMEGSVGMVVPVGPLVTAVTEVGRDRALIDPQRRYMPDGRAVTVRSPAWNVEAASDAEKPAGAWNVLDLYVLGDRAVHVVNGVPVMAVRDLRMREGGAWVPLAHGRIQLQSEGAETYFRRITLEPITRLPRVVQD